MIKVRNSNSPNFTRGDKFFHCFPRFQVVYIVKHDFGSLLVLRDREDIVVGMFTGIFEARSTYFDLFEAPERFLRQKTSIVLLTLESASDTSRDSQVQVLAYFDHTQPQLDQVDENGSTILPL